MLALLARAAVVWSGPRLPPSLKGLIDPGGFLFSPRSFSENIFSFMHSFALTPVLPLACFFLSIGLFTRLLAPKLRWMLASRIKLALE